MTAYENMTTQKIADEFELGRITSEIGRRLLGKSVLLAEQVEKGDALAIAVNLSQKAFRKAHVRNDPAIGVAAGEALLALLDVWETALKNPMGELANGDDHWRVGRYITDKLKIADRDVFETAIYLWGEYGETYDEFYPNAETVQAMMATLRAAKLEGEVEIEHYKLLYAALKAARKAGVYSFDLVENI